MKEMFKRKINLKIFPIHILPALSESLINLSVKSIIILQIINLRYWTTGKYLLSLDSISCS